MDDLISREAALDCFNDWIDHFGHLHSADEDTAYQKIEALPSAVRTGKWLPLFDGKFVGGAYWYECSECKHTVPGGLQSLKIFCENCGADMRNDQDA